MGIVIKNQTARFDTLPDPKSVLRGGSTRYLPKTFQKPSEKNGTATADIPNPKRLESFGVKVESLPNSGHEMMISNPEDFTHLLNSFIRTI